MAEISISGGVCSYPRTLVRHIWLPGLSSQPAPLRVNGRSQIADIADIEGFELEAVILEDSDWETEVVGLRHGFALSYRQYFVADRLRYCIYVSRSAASILKFLYALHMTSCDTL